MFRSRILRFIIYLFATALILSGCKRHEPFTPKGWDDGDGLSFPKRYLMVDSLLASKKLIGLKYKQVVWLLKAPQRNSFTDRSFSYEITRKMNGVDTLHTKDLVIYLNKDSVVTSAKVVEKDYNWKPKKKK
ncbi:hypothetical protein DYU05_11790 [Mucilaginibacter terrenus]|uniref:Uncharacterized protein n=1 Tax=Mucilaginibacter terrenus TaxID=2482727 RepID=A0A3E2NPB0_9SPHI|nr:hypothetical protein [Mucilaginibacter terrenus]RFZ82839.1 hypothetical protein DYU05_11790 [Mucilaginibacter terrenus]